MPPKNEGRTAGDFVLFDQAEYSRESAVIGAGADLEPGTVLGKITATGKYVRCASGASDGSQTPVAVLRTQAPAASADVTAVIQARHTRVRRFGLIFDASFATEADRNGACAALKEVGILAT